MVESRVVRGWMVATRRAGLAACREALGLTQEDLARRLGVEFNTVGRYERGELTPRPRRRPKLAEALGVSLGELDVLLRGGELAAAAVVSRGEVITDAALATGAVAAGTLTPTSPPAADVNTA